MAKSRKSKVGSGSSVYNLGPPTYLLFSVSLFWQKSVSGNCFMLSSLPYFPTFCRSAIPTSHYIFSFSLLLVTHLFPEHYCIPIHLCLHRLALSSNCTTFPGVMQKWPRMGSSNVSMAPWSAPSTLWRPVSSTIIQNSMWIISVVQDYHKVS